MDHVVFVWGVSRIALALVVNERYSCPFYKFLFEATLLVHEVVLRVFLVGAGLGSYLLFRNITGVLGVERVVGVAHLRSSSLLLFLLLFRIGLF